MESIGIEPILFACKAKDLPINLWSLYISYPLYYPPNLYISSGLYKYKYIYNIVNRYISKYLYI